MPNIDKLVDYPLVMEEGISGQLTLPENLSSRDVDRIILILTAICRAHGVKKTVPDTVNPQD